jgi:2-phosphosulfolactate phosphatase
MIHWHCHDVFDRMPGGSPAGGIAVILDVLRASTTMITALAHGAREILPVADVEAARRRAEESEQPVLLGGERRGIRVPGFDLGNSPLEYTPAAVAGRVIVFTTTNGTAALHAARDAREILVGAIVNRTAVAETIRRLAAAVDTVHLVCAGTDGLVTAEDLLAAGAILEAATAIESGDIVDEGGRNALALFRHATATPDTQRSLVAEFRRSPGGANLVALGMEPDLVAAAAIDTIPSVPRLDPSTGILKAARSPE